MSVFIGKCGCLVPVEASGRIRPCVCDGPTTSRRPDYFAQLCAAVEDLARLRYLLSEVVNLARAGQQNPPAGRRSSYSPRPAPGARPVPCPYCGATSGVRQTSDTGRIEAWACDRCGTDWALTVPNSRTAAALLGDLGAVAQEIRRLRWILRQLVMLADEMPKLTDVELRTRLLLLTELGAPVPPARVGYLTAGR